MPVLTAEFVIQEALEAIAMEPIWAAQEREEALAPLYSRLWEQDHREAEEYLMAKYAERAFWGAFHEANPGVWEGSQAARDLGRAWKAVVL